MESVTVQIPYDVYQSIRKYEIQTKRPIGTSVLFQIGELNGEWHVFRVTKIEVDEYERYIMTGEIVATFRTHAEAKMKIKQLRYAAEQCFGMKF